MADIITREQRSKNMSAIKSRDTKPEIYIRRLLFANGFRYRIDCRYIPGRPDIFLRRYNTAVFIHGCFWHRHSGCKIAYTPKSNTEFWQKKFNANTQRDLKVRQQLTTDKVRILTVWECTCRAMIKSPEYEQEIMHQICNFIRSDEYSAEF